MKILIKRENATKKAHNINDVAGDRKKFLFLEF